MAILIVLVLLSHAFATPIFLDENWKSGFITINKQYDIFYWLFRSRLNTKRPPLILWLGEGPGCSSVASVLTENGPYRISDDLNLTYNSFSWNNYADVLYIDQPLGTGFTTCKNSSRIPRTQLEVARDLESFLNLFLRDHYEYYGRKFYIAGRSYGGHYVPYFANYLNNKEFDSLRLKGIAIGNGLFSYSDQMLSYPKFSYQSGLITSPFKYAGAFVSYQIARFFVGLGFSSTAYFFLTLGNAIITGIRKSFNIYDITKECIVSKDSPGIFQPICYNFTKLFDFMKRKDVLKELGVGNRTWELCSPSVFQRMLPQDVFANMSPVFENLLASHNPIKIVIFNGVNDWFCNTLGVGNFLKKLKWQNQTAFNNEPLKSWHVSGRVAGKYKSVESLSYYEVKDAGHMVSHDQPESEYDVLTRMIYP